MKTKVKMIMLIILGSLILISNLTLGEINDIEFHVINFCLGGIFVLSIMKEENN